MWLAFRFLHWALDCRISTGADSTYAPALVVAFRARRQRVVAASPEALEAGIRRGMDLADARLRLSGLAVYERDVAQENAAMGRLAGWAWGYSSQLHWAIADDNIECTRLVMEIGASLRLFGGLDTLSRQIKRDMARSGYRYRAGLGDTPQAALAFARADRRTRRQRKLSLLSLTCLDLAPDAQTTLIASGIRTAADLLALPHSTLARRFDSALLAEIERLQGRRPHGLALYELPPRYDTQHELTGAVEQIQGLIFVLRRVFNELSRFLRGADSMIQALRLSLIHEHQSPTRIILRLSAPTHDAHHLEQIAHQRLERTTLAAPVVAVSLLSDRLRRTAYQQQGFWHRAGARSQRDEWPATLDRLRARLGHDAVVWLHAPADHRPSEASVTRDHPPVTPTADTTIANTDPLPRPLWLVETATPVSPAHLEQLSWISGPERIESGWWQESQRRDYYRAIDHQGRLVWIFRNLETMQETPAATFHIHGLFG